MMFLYRLIIGVFAMAIFFGCSRVERTGDKMTPLPNKDNFSLERRIEYLDNILERENEQSEYYFQRAQLLSQTTRIQQARRDIENAIRLGGDQPAYHFLRARILLRNEQYEDALVSAKIAENAGISTPTLNAILGELYFRVSNWQESLKYFQRTRSVLSDAPESSYFMGSIFAKQGDTTNAVRFLKEAITVKPSYQPAYADLIKLYTQFEEYRNALIYAGKGLKNFEPDAPYCYEVAGLVKNVYSVDSAVYWYQKTLEKDPAYWQANLDLARFYYQKRNFVVAEKYYQSVLNLQPQMSEPYFELGFIYEYYITDLDKAMKSYQRALELDSANTNIPWAIKRVDRKINFKTFFDDL